MAKFGLAHSVYALVRGERIQHMIKAKTIDEIYDKIQRAYKGQAKIYRIDGKLVGK